MSAPRPFAPTLLLVLGLAVGCGGGAAPTSTQAPTDEPTTEPTAAATTEPTETPGAIETDTPVPGTPALPDLTKIATGLVPSGWKTVATADNVCTIAVPPDWDTETMAGAALAPNLGGQVMLSNDSLANYGSWEDYKNTAKTVYFADDRLVLTDTEDLFVMAAGPSSTDASVIVGVNRGETVCGVLMTITSNGIAESLDDGFQILYSLATAAG